MSRLKCFCRVCGKKRFTVLGQVKDLKILSVDKKGMADASFRQEIVCEFCRSNSIEIEYVTVNAIIDTAIEKEV